MTSPLAWGGPLAASWATAGWRPAGTLRRRNRAAGRTLADAQQRRCLLPTAAVEDRVTAAAGPASWPRSFIRYRHRRPGHGITCVVGTNDRNDRIGAHGLLR